VLEDTVELDTEEYFVIEELEELLLEELDEELEELEDQLELQLELEELELDQELL
jgi:hypothetical protein